MWVLALANHAHARAPDANETPKRMRSRVAPSIQKANDGSVRQSGSGQSAQTIGDTSDKVDKSDGSTQSQSRWLDRDFGSGPMGRTATASRPSFSRMAGARLVVVGLGCMAYTLIFSGFTVRPTLRHLSAHRVMALAAGFCLVLAGVVLIAVA